MVLERRRRDGLRRFAGFAAFFVKGEGSDRLMLDEGVGVAVQIHKDGFDSVGPVFGLLSENHTALL